MARLFFRFRHSFLSGLKADFRMGAVAKWFLGRCAAAAKRHPFFDRIFVSVCVDQLDFARYDVRSVLDCFDCYLRHGGIVTEVDRVVLNAMADQAPKAEMFGIVFREADPPGFVARFNAT
jgi:hypothetical protein